MGKKKIKTVLKPQKNTIAYTNNYIVFSVPDKRVDGNEYGEYVEHYIEKKENSITFRAYIEKTYNLTSKKDREQLEKVLLNQKSPLPKIITNYEAMERKEATETIWKGGTPANIYKLDNMHEIE